jgi:hypothetical protein
LGASRVAAARLLQDQALVEQVLDLAFAEREVTRALEGARAGWRHRDRAPDRRRVAAAALERQRRHRRQIEPQAIARVLALEPARAQLLRRPAHQLRTLVGPRQRALDGGVELAEVAEQESVLAVADALGVRLERRADRQRAARRVFEELHIGTAAVELGRQQRTEPDRQAAHERAVGVDAAAERELELARRYPREQIAQRRVAHDRQRDLGVSRQRAPQHRDHPLDVLAMAERAAPADAHAAAPRRARRRRLPQLIREDRLPRVQVAEAPRQRLDSGLQAVRLSRQL